MFNLGVQEVMMIFLILMVLFGTRQLPDIGKGLGKGIWEFKRATEHAEEDDLQPAASKRERSYPNQDVSAEPPLSPIK